MFLRQMAEALVVLHGAGVLHRDLKPGNVMLRDETSVALIDYGMSKQLALDAAITGSGEIFGTPYYMSPEQGHGRETDERSDIYSVGIIFFEMLMRRKPYVAGTPMQVIYKHAHAPLPELRAELKHFEGLLLQLHREGSAASLRAAPTSCWTPRGNSNATRWSADQAGQASRRQPASSHCSTLAVAASRRARRACRSLPPQPEAMHLRPVSMAVDQEIDAGGPHQRFRPPPVHVGDVFAATREVRAAAGAGLCRQLAPASIGRRMKPSCTAGIAHERTQPLVGAIVHAQTVAMRQQRARAADRDDRGSSSSSAPASAQNRSPIRKSRLPRIT